LVRELLRTRCAPLKKVAMRRPSPLRFLVRSLTLAASTSLIVACSVTTEEEDPVGQTDAAYTGPIASLTDTDAPPGAPGSWDQPDSEGIVGQNGYCGATAAANLLHWYGKEVSPRQAIDGGCWSYIGTRPAQLGKYMKNTYPDLGCAYGTMDYDADALGNLRAALAVGRPVVVEFMTGSLNAHWVTVIGVRGAGEHPELVLMTWGRFVTAKWDDFKDAWRRAWGGYYPYVMCQAISPLKSALFTE
jgi:hypothetical protein